MVIALSVWGTSIASSTLATAGQLATALGGVSSPTSSKIGTATGYGELTALGTTAAWAAAGSIGAPTGLGWILDPATLSLVGQTLIAGTWTPKIRLKAGSGAVTGDVYMRFYKRSSGGVYTAIGSLVASGVTLTVSFAAFTPTAGSLGAMSFGSGDVLYIDAWLNASSNAGGSAAVISVDLSSTAFGLANCVEVATPGYQVSGTQHTLDAKGRFSLKAQNTRSGQGRFSLKAQKTRNAQGRFFLKASKTRNAQGRISLRAQKTRDAQGRFSLKAQRTRNAQGRFVLNTVGAGIFVFAGGTLIQVLLADGINIDDKANARSTASFTVIGSVAAQLQQNMDILIFDTSRGIQLYAGTIDTITLNRLTPQNIWLWKVQCKDGHYDADKRIWTGRELSGYLAGDAVALMHQEVLAQEGIKANYVMRADNTSAAWAEGTNSNVATPSDDTLQLASSGSDFIIAEQSQSDWASGTLTNVVAVNGTLQLASSSAIKMSGDAVSGRGTNLFAYFNVWAGSVAVATGDYLECDIWINSRSKLIKGGVDLIASDGTTLRDNGAVDQNGVSSHPGTDLNGYANDQWYHRHIVVPSALVGKTINSVRLALEGDDNGSYTIYVRHIKYYASGGSLKATFYESGGLNTNTLYSINGFLNIQVAPITVYETMGTRVSPVHVNSVCPLVRTSFVQWLEVDPVQESTSNSSVTSPPVLVEASFDNGGTWQTLTNAQALSFLVPGMNISGTSWLLRETLALAGPSPEQTPILEYLFLTLQPAYQATVTAVNDIDKVGDGSFATGTLTRLTNAATGLMLTGNYKSFAGGDVSGFTMFTSGTNGIIVPWREAVALWADAGKDTRARVNGIGSVTNFQLELDVLLGDLSGNTNIGIVYRTTSWGTGNNYAYSVNITPTHVSFSKGDDNSAGGTNVDVNIVSVAATFQANQWYRILVVANGSNHQVWVDGTRYINQTDSSFTGAGQIALRYYNNSTGRNQGYFDNLGINTSILTLPITGTRVNPSLSISSVGIVGDSRIYWNEVTPAQASLLVEASTNGGANYFPCTNGGVIPGVTPGTNVAGKSLLIRETFTSQNVNATPLLTGMHVMIWSAYSATGTRVSPVLALSAIGRVGSTSLTWDADTPLGTSLVAATSPDNITYTTIAAPGNPIAGINDQPDQAAEDFLLDDHANWTATNYAGGAAPIGTWDTTNSRLQLSGGTNGLYLWTAAAPANFKDGTFTAVLTQVDNAALVMRYTDATSHYRLIIRDASSSQAQTQVIQLFRRAASVNTQLGANTPIVFARGEPHTLAWSIVGSVHTILFDGIQVLQVTDGTPITNAGQVGIFQNNVTAPSLWQSIAVQPLGDDVTGQNAYYELTLNSTDPTATPVVRSAVLSARGPQIMDGQVLKQTSYKYKNVASNIDDASKQSNTWWAIDQNLNLLFQNRSAQLAPWAFWTGLRSDGSCDLQYAPQPTVKFASPQYRNRQYITGAYQATPFVDMKQGDGQASSWALSAKIISITEVSVNGEARTFGIQGVDSGRDFYYTPGEVNIALAQNTTVLAKNEVATITFVGQSPYTAMKQDTAQQALLASLDSRSRSSGIVEAVEDGTGLDSVAADALAQARIDQNAKLTRDWSFTTMRLGLAPGQLLPVFANEFNLWDAAMLITAIKTRVILLVDGTYQLYFDVSCSEGPPLGSWARIFTLAS